MEILPEKQPRCKTRCPCLTANNRRHNLAGSCLCVFSVLCHSFPARFFLIWPYLQTALQRKHHYQFRKCVWTTDFTKARHKTKTWALPLNALGGESKALAAFIPTDQRAAVSDKQQAEHNFHVSFPIHGSVNTICKARERNHCPAPRALCFCC